MLALHVVAVAVDRATCTRHGARLNDLKRLCSECLGQQDRCDQTQLPARKAQIQAQVGTGDVTNYMDWKKQGLLGSRDFQPIQSR